MFHIKMIRKNRYQEKVQNLTTYQKSVSNSTNQSESPRYSNKDVISMGSFKEKLELCRKFIQHGFCPYKNKCKFAHGSHELRKNNQKNSLYKTKECGNFFREGYCGYGDRCNFLHERHRPLTNEELRQVADNFGGLFEEMREESRLLKILL